MGAWTRGEPARAASRHARARRLDAGAATHEWSPEGLADEVVWFLDALGLERVHYIGESVGGITGIVLGARYPDRFHSVTLVQTPLHLRPVGDLIRGSYESWPSAIRALGPGGWTTQNMSADDPRTAWEGAQWDRCDTEALCRLADATPAVDVTAYVAAMRTPTLVLAPTESPLTPLEDQLYLPPPSPTPNSSSSKASATPSTRTSRSDASLGSSSSSSIRTD